MTSMRSTVTLLLLRYCILDAISSSVLGEFCGTEALEDASERPKAHCLLQHRLARTAESILIGKPLPLQDNATKAALVQPSFENASTAAAAVDNPHLADEGNVHHSIFELSFAQLDQKTFWFVYACMLVFTIAVDQLENWAAKRAEHSPNEKRFLSRVNSELMMFGFVGLFLFVLNNIGDLPEEQHILIEFVDILCSMGACGLIAIAAVLFVVRKYNDRMWKRAEMENLLDSPIVPTGPSEVGFLHKCFCMEWMTAMDYQVMAKEFLLNQGLPNDFMYSDYLNYTLCNTACDLMDVQWYTWLVMLIIVLVLLLIRTIRGTHFQNFVYIIMFTMTNWLVFVCCVILLCRVNFKYVELLSQIRRHQEDFQKSGLKMSQHFEKKALISASDLAKVEKVEGWSGWMKFAMQLIALANSFLSAFFVLHLQYNLVAAGYSWIWTPLLVFPLIASLFVMLPLITSRFTITQAYFSEDNADALDSTMVQLNQLKEDFEYLSRRWEAKGKPAFPVSEEGVDEEGLGKVLKDLGVTPIGTARRHRIFQALDADKGGTVTARELMSRLDKSAQPEPPKASTLNKEGESESSNYTSCSGGTAPSKSTEVNKP